MTSDAERVFALVQQFATSYRPDRAAFDRHFPPLLAADHVDCVVAELGVGDGTHAGESADRQGRESAGHVVGYAVAFRLVTLYANGIVAELQELMVAPEHRGLGIGRQLVATILDRARAAGAVEVTVPTRRAGPYYRRLGFEEAATYYKLRLARHQRE